MVLHGLNRIFQKPTPNLSSSDRTNQLRSKTVYAGTVDLSTTLATPGNDRYKTYNGPYEIAKKNVYGDATLVASASYKDLLDITKGKVLLNQLPLTDSTYPYYEKNFGNGEMYVGNYQQFDGSKPGPIGCIDSVLVYDLSSTGFTGPGSYTGNSIGYTGPSGMFGSNQDIFIDPTHCYYSDPCASSASYMKFVDVNFKGPTGATGITGPSQYFAQQIIKSDQYNGFRFPMSNFTFTCNQQIDSQSEGPLFCPALQPTLSGFSYPPEPYDSPALQITPPQSNSLGAFSYFSSNPSVAIISSSPSSIMFNSFDSYIYTITIVGVGTTMITAVQEPYGIYSSGSISTPFVVEPITFTATWEYTNDGGLSHTDILTNLSLPYDQKTYTIRLKGTTPTATYTQSGTASALNAGNTAQLTLTGSGNFVGSVTSPSITVTLATFSVITWRYLNNGVFDLLGNLTPVYDNTSYLISAISSIISPSYATYTQSGTASVTNVADPAAQVTLTGYGNFVGSFTSPSITVTVATFSVTTWKYTNGGVFDLPGNLTPVYDNSLYSISVVDSIISPSYATYTQSGTASVKDVADGTALITLTGSGNFVGSNHQSPSITVTVATFTVTTWQYTHNGTTTDLTSNLSFPPDGFPYIISFVSSTISPSYATYTPTGNPSQSALNNGDIARLILAGTGNFVGCDPQSPSISILVENSLTVSNDFVLGTTYSVGYLNSSLDPSSSIQVGGYTFYRFFPITTTNGTVTPTTTVSVAPITTFNIRYLVVGGGGSGGMGNSQNYESGDGGNAGTLIDSSGSFTINSSIPLIVGGPGSGGPGSDSTFSTVTANGGANGGIVNISGGNGGSGAGGPGGGGGSGGGGSGGAGGPGVLNNITGGSGVYYAGGGGGCGGHNQHSSGSGGSGGSGVGGQGQSMTSGGAPYSNGANGFGGGGGGTHGPATTVGGSGVVILRFPSYTT